MEQQMQAGLVNRRSFLRKTGLAGLSAAGAAVLIEGAAPRSARAQSTTLSAADIEVLQFALNLEYLEAEFYSYAVTGMSLQQNGVGVTGAVGTYGPTTGGAQVPFAQLAHIGPLAPITAQLMRDEVNHVNLLRSVLGAQYTIAKPAIKLDVLGSMANLGTFLLLARDFEVVGASAYGGAITLLDSAVLQAAAQIAEVEAFHVGTLQLLCDLNDLGVPPVDSMDMTPPPGGQNFFDDSLDTSLAVIRTPSQVLQLTYLNATPGTGAGGFFPAGFNGQITTV